MKKSSSLILLSACLTAVLSCQPIEPEGKTDDKPDVVIPAPVAKVIDYSKTNLGELAWKQGIRLGAAFTY